MSERAYYREIHTKGNADSIVTGSRMGDCVTAAGCSVARWKVAGTAAVVGGCRWWCLTRSAGFPASRDRLRGLLTAGTAEDGSCCWLNIHRKYHDIARAYCAGPRTPHTVTDETLRSERIYSRKYRTQNRTALTDGGLSD